LRRVGHPEVVHQRDVDDLEPVTEGRRPKLVETGGGGLADVGVLQLHRAEPELVAADPDEVAEREAPGDQRGAVGLGGAAEVHGSLLYLSSGRDGSGLRPARRRSLLHCAQGSMTTFIESGAMAFSTAVATS